MKEKKGTDTGHRLLNQVSDISGMPKDVVLGAPILTVTGQAELLVENYRGILEYTDLLIRIQTKTGQIRITGKRLQVEYYTNDEMKITGKITEIEYIN
ncbi:MAG: YabP/YqfC family sporulation protein [Eubacteriales bacterium]|nr:YabP/YqfC family sporulation protein [Eubacteriales bacterium]